mgnify:CR=1 FL=1|jgi:hypothetical protein
MADHRTDIAETLDPRGLISESYLIPDITPEDCRSIFFDWALGRSAAEGDPDAAALLLTLYEPLHPVHPMTDVLREGLRAVPRRRGGPGARRL